MREKRQKNSFCQFAQKTDGRQQNCLHCLFLLQESISNISWKFTTVILRFSEGHIYQLNFNKIGHWINTHIYSSERLSVRTGLECLLSVFSPNEMIIRAVILKAGSILSLWRLVMHLDSYDVRRRPVNGEI